ncbi:MAG: hypothetical protein KIH80_005535 [Flavobacteriia bacterium]|nr:hypothetical protein [Flavobacteriia bacterium]
MRHFTFHKHIYSVIFVGFLLLSCSSDGGDSEPVAVPKATFTLTISAANGGAVSSSGGSYEQGKTVTVTATAAQGYEFTSWSDGNTNATRTFTVSNNTAVTANFSLKITPPSAANLSFPENNKVCLEGVTVSDTESKVNFQWAASANTTNYDLVITDIQSQISTNYEGITQANKEVTLLAATSYSWKVISKATVTNEVATSAQWQFYLAGPGEESFAPYPASDLSPSSGATVTATNGEVTLQWNGEDPDGDELTYTVYIDTTDGFQDPEGTIKNLTVTETSFSVTSNTVYYWRVKSSDGTNSAFTQVYSFRVE